MHWKIWSIDALEDLEYCGRVMNGTIVHRLCVGGEKKTILKKHFKTFYTFHVSWSVGLQLAFCLIKWVKELQLIFKDLHTHLSLFFTRINYI